MSAIILLALLALAGAVALAVLHFSRSGPAKAARHWPVAPGIMLATRVDDPAPGGPARWRPLVHYRYRVGDRDYEGTQLRPGETNAASAEAAHAMVGRYPPGSQIMVRFNPSRPEESVLELPQQSPLLLVGAGVLTLLGLAPIAIAAASEFGLFDDPYRPPSPAIDVSVNAPPTMGTTAPMANTTAPASGPALVSTYFFGLWTEDGNCYPAALSFQSDGTFRTRGGGSGTWYVLGDGLALQGRGGSRTLRIEVVGQNSFRADGSAIPTTRCIGGTAP